MNPFDQLIKYADPAEREREQRKDNEFRRAQAARERREEVAGSMPATPKPVKKAKTEKTVTITVTMKDAEMKELLPEQKGQPRVMTVAGSGPDAGHWYSPAAARELAVKEREQAKREMLSGLMDCRICVHFSEDGCRSTIQCVGGLRFSNIPAKRLWR